ncbi:hypothetical protein P3T27_008155 [Kitasatospora sp. MAA19]|nr:hypothetical protein [Kitasatospora sp. MAA19]
MRSRPSASAIADIPTPLSYRACTAAWRSRRWTARRPSISTGTRFAARARVHRWSSQPWASGPRSNSRSNRAIWASDSFGRPGEPFEAIPAAPPSRHCRRQRSTERTLTRSAAAMSLLFSPLSKRSTACCRIRSRAAPSASVKPPTCAYLTAHDYRDRPSTGRRTLRLHPSERHHEFNFSSCAGRHRAAGICVRVGSETANRDAGTAGCPASRSAANAAPSAGCGRTLLMPMAQQQAKPSGRVNDQHGLRPRVQRRSQPAACGRPCRWGKRAALRAR